MRQDITIVEVGPRDGLQFEKLVLEPKQAIQFIDLLSKSGLKVIECTSFVSPAKIPQMAHAQEILSGIVKTPGIRYISLVPNSAGLEAALQSKTRAIAIFTAASDSFTLKNIGCTIEESFKRFEPVMEKAKAEGIWVRGYLSCAMGCPYEGAVSLKKVAEIAYRLKQLGCDEISIADTIGSGIPVEVPPLIEAISKKVPVESLAVHFHDTPERLAIPKVLKAIASGVTVIDSAVGNLGGCPYAPGASGNVATESVVAALEKEGYQTGVCLPILLEARDFVFALLGRKPGT